MKATAPGLALIGVVMKIVSLLQDRQGICLRLIDRPKVVVMPQLREGNCRYLPGATMLLDIKACLIQQPPAAAARSRGSSMA